MTENTAAKNAAAYVMAAAPADRLAAWNAAYVSLPAEARDEFQAEVARLDAVMMEEAAEAAAEKERELYVAELTGPAAAEHTPAVRAARAALEAARPELSDLDLEDTVRRSLDTTAGDAGHDEGRALRVALRTVTAPGGQAEQVARTARILPAMPADAQVLAVDVWTEEDGGTAAYLFDRTGHEDQDGEWGDPLGPAALTDEEDADDVAAALRSAGWTQGEPLPYSLPDATGTVTTWTR